MGNQNQTSSCGIKVKLKERGYLVLLVTTTYSHWKRYQIDI
jgi:hypothetical protein